MALNDILKQVDELQERINSYGKLERTVLNRINYKFRLDWNYHSNAMEGNSLTQQETRSIMVNNITVDEKPLKDVIEIKGHDAIISEILKIGKGELRLSEKRLKDIHKAIIHEESPEQKAKIGTWKTENNYLINYKDEKYEFMPPSEVPEAMHNLMNWLNGNIDAIKTNKKAGIHPAKLAFEFHITYISIHPFYDGNGRTARILMNLILISFGYPPVIVKLSDKTTYYQYLADIQAYGGNPDLFLEFMGKLLLKSQQLVLTAIEGGNIDEPDDLDKKILLLEKELESVDPDNEVKLRFNADVFIEMYDTWIYNLLKKCIENAQKFNKFFTGIHHSIRIEGAGISYRDEPAEETLEKFKIKIQLHIDQFSKYENNLEFSLSYGTFKKGGINSFGCNYGFNIKFDFTKYTIYIDEFSEEISARIIFLEPRLLHKPLTHSEMEKLAKMLGDAIYDHIDFHTKKNGIR